MAAFDLSPSDEQQELKRVLHEIAERELRPVAREVEAQGEMPVGLWKLLWETGVTAPIAEEYGGAGLPDTVTMTIAAEELGWGDPAIAYCALASSFVPLLITMLGTEQQRERLLDPFRQGPARGSLALFETNGAAPSWMDTELTVDGSKTTLSGRKALVLDPEQSDVALCVARDDRGRPVICEVPTDAGARTSEAKLGLEGVPTVGVTFHNVELTDDALLGSGADAATAVAHCRLAVAAICVGTARAATEYAATYASEREAFGQPIGAFQGISFTIADMATRTDAARLLIWHAASALDRGLYNERDVTMACAHATEVAVANGNDAVQILGGAGYVQDHPVEKWYRDAQTLATLESPDVNANAYLAEQA